jgi:peroxiredoxin
MSLVVGDTVPDFTVLRKHGEQVTGSELFVQALTVVLFYVFDFSGSLERG